MPTLEQSHLKAGDILLSLGQGEVSDAIKSLDGGSYSHAGIWDGGGVIEAIWPKVHRSAFDGCCKKARYIDVYRYENGATKAERVVTEATAFLGTKYADVDLLLATAILSVSALLPGEWSELNFVFGAEKLRGLMGMLLQIHRKRPRERLTCVGLAARAHLQAELPIGVGLESGRKFEPRVMLRAIWSLRSLWGAHRAENGLEASDETAADLAFLEELERDLDRAEERHRSEGSAPAPHGASWRGVRWDWERALVNEELIQKPEHRSGGEEASVDELLARTFVAGKDWSAALVTPRQFEQSDNLVLAGRVWNVESR